MKILGTPGPSRLKIIFEEGEFTGRSITVAAEPLMGGIALSMKSVKGWDENPNEEFTESVRAQIILLIREDFDKNSPIYCVFDNQ